MFPKKYFSKKFFTSRYWPPVGILVDYVLHPVKYFYRSIVQTLFTDVVIEQTFASVGVQTEFTANAIQVTFIDDKINTPIKAAKRTVVFYESRPARS